MVLFQMQTLQFWLQKPWSDKHSSNPISCNVNFEPTFLEESRRYPFCLSLLRPHFSLRRNKKHITEFSMSPVTQYINILAITITFFSKMAGVWEVFSHSFLWGPCQLWLCYCSSICAARETVQPLKLFQPSYFPAFLPFQLFQIFIFLPFQRIYTFRFMFSFQTGQLSKCSPFLSGFSPLTIQLHCLNIHTLFHPEGSKPPNYKWNDFLNRRHCMNKPRRQQHAPMRVDCEGPFIAACSFNFNCIL